MARDLSEYVQGSRESDIGRLKSDVGAVMSDLDEFRMRMVDAGIRLDEAGSQAMSAGAGFGDTDAGMSGSAVDGDERAFEVSGVEFDDTGAEKEQIDEWTVYVPPGCVQIDGVAVKFDDDVSEDRVSVSPDVRGGITLYCVVWKDSAGAAHARICEGDDERDGLVGRIGGNGGTLYASVPFCTLSDTYEDNNQIHLGVIALTSGGTGGRPGPFEPVFGSGGISEVGWGYIPFGRRFIAVPPNQADPPLQDGLICLKVTHATRSDSGAGGYHTLLTSELVTLDVEFAEEGGVTGLPDIRQEDGDGEPDLEHTLLPLYVVRAGVILLDFRHYLSLPAREDS